MQFSSKENIDIKQDIKSGLYIVSSPIGNLYDITLRAIYVLKNSELILCEDTRTSIKLFKKFNINAKIERKCRYVSVSVIMESVCFMKIGCQS